MSGCLQRPSFGGDAVDAVGFNKCVRTNELLHSDIYRTGQITLEAIGCEALSYGDDQRQMSLFAIGERLPHEVTDAVCSVRHVDRVPEIDRHDAD